MEQIRDIDLARDRLLEGQYSLVIVKQGKLLFTSRDQGIKPIYSAVTQLGEILEGAVLADRVIGKAAAMLCSLAQVKSVYAELISSKAMEALNEAGIDLEYNKACPYILNRSQDGMCPIEKLAASIDDGQLLLKAIGQFLKDRE